MLNKKFFANATAALGAFCLLLPASLLAQGSPDIIWKRQVSQDRVNSVIFSADGNTMISGGSDRLINLWRVSDGALQQTLNSSAPFVHESAIESLTITPDASLLASCSYQLIQLWKLPSGAMQRLTGHTDWVVGVAFSPNGSLLASASFDTTTKIWQASDGALLKTITGIGQQRCVAFSPDGSLLAVAGGGDKAVRIFRTSDWTLVRTLFGHSQDVFVVAFSPDGNTIASGGYDRTVKLWNVANGALKYTFSGNGGVVYGLAFTPDGSKLGYTDGEGNMIKIYRTSDGALLRTYNLEVDQVQTVAFSRDGLLGYGRIDETVVLSRIDTSPSARITSPASGTTFYVPTNITIAASPSKTDGSITKMEFFKNGVKLGEDFTAPYSFNWNNSTPGTYSLTVVDTDVSGATTRSGGVTVIVVDPATQPPTVSITSPSQGATLNAPASITIQAAAFSRDGVSKVEFFQNGASLGQDATEPFSVQWSAVSAGSYSLTAVMTDAKGATALSAPISISVAEGLVETSSSITLQASGNGKIKLLKDGQILKVAKTYKVQAVPNADNVFTGWTGSINDEAQTLSFTMIDGMSLTANFIPNPFALTKGTYYGLIQAAKPIHQRTGFLRIVTTRAGTLSGKISIGGKAYSLRGKFQSDGSFSFNLPNPEMVLQLQLHLDDGSDQITGSLAMGSLVSTLVGNRQVYNAKTNPSPEAGKYTVLIPSNPSRPNTPPGSGFGIMKVDASGMTRTAGSLADGTPFTQSAALSKVSTLPLYVAAYAGEGSISGILYFRNEATISDLDGTVNWFRPAMAGANVFPDGFVTQTTLLGSFYTPSPGTAVLSVPNQEDNVLINLDNDDENVRLRQPATLDANNKIVVPQANTEKINASISGTKGLLKGSFIHPLTGVKTSHRGVVYQKQNVAEGYFLGSGQSGIVSVVPVDASIPIGVSFPHDTTTNPTNTTTNPTNTTTNPTNTTTNPTNTTTNPTNTTTNPTNTTTNPTNTTTNPTNTTT
ncbi:MAG: Ig-like domain-containing protein, partial [Verrucomicrobiota bacterium]